MATVTSGRATDYITFTRTSNATVTDSNGFIKWAGHNLLTNSESFDASAWVKNGVSVSANAFAAPNGTTTADKLIASNTTAVHRTYVTALPDFTKTAVIFARAAEYNFISIGQTTGAYAVVNLTTGAVTQSSGTIPAPVSVGSGWWRIEIPNTTTDYVLSVVDTGTFTADQYGSKSFTGDNTSGVYVWGAHLYRSDLGGMVLNPARGDAYYPTTPRNRLGFTEDFSNAVWVKNSTTVATNTEISPNGLQTADTLTASAGTGVIPRVADTASATTITNTVYTASIYAKPGTYQFLQIYINSQGTEWANYTLSGSGSASANGSATASITSVGNGWYRLSITYTAGGTDRLPLFMLAASASATRAQSWNPVGTESIYLWGAQLSDSASLDAYSPVYGAAVTSAAYYAPRLDYDANGSALGLLVEEQRTNFLLHSNAFDQTDWLKLAGGTGVVPVVTPNVGVSPDGTSTADRVQFDRGAGTTSADISRIFQDYTDPASGVATNSIWIKSYDGSSTYTMLLQNGSGSSTITVTGAWQRFVISSASTSANFQLRLQGDLTPATADVLLAAAQSEYGSFATSYIPTGASTATRTKDFPQISTQAIPYSQTEGTLVVSWAMIAAKTGFGYPSVAQFDDGTNLIGVRQDGTNDMRRYGVVVDGASQPNVFASPAETPAANTVLKSGLAYKANDLAFTRGGSISTASTGSIPTNMTRLRIGHNQSDIYINCWIRQITYLPRRISNSELQARTV